MTRKERSRHSAVEVQKVHEWCKTNSFNYQTHQGGNIMVWKGDKRINLFLVSMSFHDLTLKIKGDIYKLPEFLDKWVNNTHLKNEDAPKLF